MIYERAHTRDLGEFGRLGVVVPVYGGTLLFSALASLGVEKIPWLVLRHPPGLEP